MNRASDIHRMAFLICGSDLSEDEKRDLRAARHYIETALSGIKKPDMETAADAEAAKYETV